MSMIEQSHRNGWHIPFDQYECTSKNTGSAI